MITYDQSGPKLTEADIKAAEKKLGRDIPEPYRKFLLEHNGGSPEPSFFMQDNKVRGIDFFFGLNVANGMSLEYHLQTFKGRIPPEYFPIARNAGGDLILMAPDGKIYFWDSEYEAEEGKPPTTENLHLVANSFEDLLASLTTEPQGG